MKGYFLFICLFFFQTSGFLFSEKPLKEKREGKVGAVIFDMDGVLRIGREPVKGSSKVVEWMEKSGCPGMILTNECRYTPETIRQDLIKMGIPYPTSWPIYTSAMAVRDFFQEKESSLDPIYVYVVGEKGLKEALSEVKKENFHVCKRYPRSVTLRAHCYVVIGAVDRVELDQLEEARHWIQSGARVLSTCSDQTDPSLKPSFIQGMPSQFIQMLKTVAPFSPYSLGKPHPFMIRRAIQLLRQQDKNLQEEDILFVGDTLETDIRLAFESNIKSVLVLTGNTGFEKVESQVIRPDYVLPSIESLLTSFFSKE